MTMRAGTITTLLLDIGNVLLTSVASFFLSRIDVLVDPLLDKLIAQGGKNMEVAKNARGQVAIAPRAPLRAIRRASVALTQILHDRLRSPRAYHFPFVLANSARARSQTASTLNPYSLITTAPGADAPNDSIPITSPYSVPA